MNLEALMPKNTKTASEQPVSGSAPSSKVAAAIEEASSAVTRTRTKVASEGPIAAIEKLAEDLSAQDREQSLKTAHLIGATMADGFMAQMAVYEKVAAQQAEKVASAATPMQGLDPSTVELVKLAQEDPQSFLALVQEAAGQDAALLKQAEDETAANLERDILHKAAEHYIAGHEVGRLMVSAR